MQEVGARKRWYSADYEALIKEDNLSANSLEDADRLAALDVGPVVVVLPMGQTKASKTPGGRHISVCPATVRDDVQCASCGICAHATRKAIIGFPAHGSGAKKAQQIFFQRSVLPDYASKLCQSIPF